MYSKGASSMMCQIKSYIQITLIVATTFAVTSCMLAAGKEQDFLNNLFLTMVAECIGAIGVIAAIKIVNKKESEDKLNEIAPKLIVLLKQLQNDHLITQDTAKACVALAVSLISEEALATLKSEYHKKLLDFEADVSGLAVTVRSDEKIGEQCGESPALRPDDSSRLLKKNIGTSGAIAQEGRGPDVPHRSSGTSGIAATTRTTWHDLLKSHHTTKAIFDHLRNLAICGAVFLAGRFIFKHTELETYTAQEILGWTRYVGFVVMVEAIALLVLNIYQSIIVLGNIVPVINIRGNKKRSHLPQTVILCCFYLPLVIAIVLTAIKR